ncbi:MAG: phosphoglucosamine mutase, partial [Solirubrobacteraceae bacterium]
MGRLFGTDGVRGPAGTVLTAELALRLGRAAVLGTPPGSTHARGAGSRVLVVRDKRASGPMLEAAFAAGAAAVGADVRLAGVLPS